MRAKRPIAVAVVLTALLVSACSSSTKSSAGSDGATAANAATAACKTPSGPPVKIMTIVDESQAANQTQPGTRAGVAAAIKRINCDGGLGTAGSPLSADICVTNLNPDDANACARKAADNPSYVGVVAGGAAEGDPGTIAGQAGLPNIPTAIFGGDLGAKTSFLPFLGDGGLLGPGEPIMACKLGLKKIALLLIQVPAAAQVTELDNAALKSYGCPNLLRTVLVPATATDLSTQVTTAADGADAVVIAVAPAQATSAFKVRQQLGLQVPFFSNSGTMSVRAIKAAGSAAEGLYVEMQTYLPPAGDTSVPGAAKFRADMEAAGQSAEVDDNSASAWLTVDLFATAAKGVATVTRASMVHALRAVSNYDAGGMIPPIDFTKPAPNPNYPRIFNDTFASEILKDGAFTSTDKLSRFIAFFKV